MCAFLLAIGLLLAPPRGVVDTLSGRVEVDWTAGRLVTTGVGATDLRAPGPDIARVAAGRNARRDAARRLAAAAKALPVAAGTAGAIFEKDAAARGRLEQALALARDLEIRYS